MPTFSPLFDYFGPDTTSAANKSVANDPTAAIALPVDINQQPPAAIPAYVAEELMRKEAFMSTLTIYLARLIGLSFVLLAACILARGNALIMAAVADGPVMLVYASFSLAAGLAIILGHNVWSGGTLPVIVTLADG